MKPLGPSSQNQWQVGEDGVDLVRAPSQPLPLKLAARPQNVTIDGRRTALLVIDMQNDFCSRGGWVDLRGIDITPVRGPIAPLNRLMPALRQAKIPVVWVNWGNRPDRLSLPPGVLYAGVRNPAGVGYGDEMPGGRGPVLERGSWGAAICADLTVDPSDIQIDKIRFSGFAHNDLDAVLRNLGVTTLLFAGVNLDRCVLATLQDASFLGYDCLLLEDCSATTGPEFCTQAAHFLVQQLYGFITGSEAVIGALSAGRS